MSLQDRFTAIEVEIRRHRYKCWSHMGELEHEIRRLKAELAECEEDRPHLIPASAKITAYLKGSTVADTTFPSGSTINLVGTVDNGAGAAIPNAVTWTADQGTITQDPANAELATLVNVPDGDVTVAMTTTNGIVAQHTYTLADLTPASADFTASAA